LDSKINSQISAMTLHSAPAALSLNSGGGGGSSTNISIMLPVAGANNPSSTMSNRQVYILKGEIALLVTSLRRNTQQRWSSQQVILFKIFQ
jgi:hypothetical protein